MKVIIAINKSEKRRLGQYACSINSGGHWGGGNIEIPEEQILSEILKKSVNKVEIPIYYVNLLLNWIADVTGTGDMLISEDESILEKLEAALEEYHESIGLRFEREIGQVEEAQKMVATLNRLTHPPVKNETKEFSGLEKTSERKEDDPSPKKKDESKISDDQLKDEDMKDYDLMDQLPVNSEDDSDKIKVTSRLKDDDNDKSFFKYILSLFSSEDRKKESGKVKKSDKENLDDLMKRAKVSAEKIKKKQ